MIRNGRPIFCLCAVLAMSLAVVVVATTPSPHPTVLPSPSAHWAHAYESTASYASIILGHSPVGITNSASAVLYYPLDDMPTHWWYANEKVVPGNTFHGDYLSPELGGIAVNQQDQNAISGTAIRFVGTQSSLRLTAYGADTDRSVAFEFWFNPAQSGASATMVFGSSLQIQLTDSFVSVLDASGTSEIFRSAPGSVAIGRYSHVIVHFGPTALGFRVARLFVDGLAQSESPVADASLNFPGSSATFNVQVSGSGSLLLDEYAQYRAAVPLDVLTADDITLRYVVGNMRACRCRPCFSGVACTALGSESYTCDACPSGYTGDGESCVSTGSGPSSASCYPVPIGHVHNPGYCAAHCTMVSACMRCAMSFTGTEQMQARVACAA